MIRLDIDNVLSVLPDVLASLRERAAEAHTTLIGGTGAGHEFLGWRDLLAEPDWDLIQDVQDTAVSIRQDADVFLCIGIGGSYLGAQAVIQALKPYLTVDGEASASADAAPEILFAGHHMSGAYIRRLLDFLEGRSVYVNVISKSGTTLEPALAFRFVRQWLESRFEDADRRIIVTTDPTEGALNVLQQNRGYKKFEIPRSVGGRFSVLTPVGLLPIAVAGIDVRSLLEGAIDGFEAYGRKAPNDAVDYAALRYGLLERAYAVELLSFFEPKLLGIARWWQQLFGESEGKQGTGLFPATAQYSTDLHSFGQYVQEGKRILIETFLMLEHDDGAVVVPPSEGDLDGLNYLTGSPMNRVNRAAYEGTARAHLDGGVPNFTVWMERLNPHALGRLIYFFEHAVGVGGYMLGINPFDQPGVEAYKKEMFRRLGRP